MTDKGGPVKIPLYLFSLFAETINAGLVKTIWLRSRHDETPAGYDPVTEVIEIDPCFDWEAYAAAYNGRYPDRGLTAEDMIVLTFFHEIGHVMRREHVLKMRVTNHNLKNFGDRPLSLVDLAAMRETPEYLAGLLPFVDEWIQALAEEVVADEYAINRFRKWKQETK